MSKKPSSKSKSASTRKTSIKSIEKAFGPILPGKGNEKTTITVSHDRASLKKYKLDGWLGIQELKTENDFYVYTQIPIDPSRVKEPITGITGEGPQNDPVRIKKAAEWLGEYNEAIERARKMAERAGEYAAELLIGGTINQRLQVRVKVDGKGKVTLAAPRSGFVLNPPN